MDSIKKIGKIREELNQLNNLNWYTKYAIAQELVKEAGWKENIFSGILAAVLMVLTGNTVEASSRETNVSIEEILKALQDPEIVDKAKKLKQKSYNMKTPQSTSLPKQKALSPNQTPSFDEIFEFIKKNEGYKTKVYKDPAGNLAIGLGFNLDRPLAKTLFKNMGIDYNAVRSGKRALSEKEIKYLFQYDVNLAINNAKEFINNFDTLPYDAKMVLIDMSYNMGLPRLSQFRNFKNALENYNFQQAAKEMKNSRWYAQVKSRGERLVNIMSNISSPTMLAKL